MGSFFNNIINDSRRSVPAVSQKPGPASVDTLNEGKQLLAHAPADQITTEPGLSPQQDRLSTIDLRQAEKNFFENTDSPDAFNQHKPQQDPGQTGSEMTIPDLQAEPPLSAQQVPDDPVVSYDENGWEQKRTKVLSARQTEETSQIPQSQPADLKQNNADDCFGDNRDSNQLASDQLNTDVRPDLPGPVTGKAQTDSQFPQQGKSEHTTDVLDGKGFLDSEIIIQDSAAKLDPGSGEEMENIARQQSLQPDRTEAIKQVIAQENSAQSSQSQTVVMNDAARAESSALRSAIPNQAEHYPQVRIGLVNVIVEGPKQMQAAKPTARSEDQSSRYYLRSL